MVQQLVLLAAALPAIIRSLGYAWKQVPGGRDPVWALDRVPHSAGGRRQRNKAGDLAINQYAYRIARHPFKAVDGSRPLERERCGWTVDVCWAVGPIWEPYLDGPFATPQEAADAVAKHGLKPGAERLPRLDN